MEICETSYETMLSAASIFGEQLSFLNALNATNARAKLHSAALDVPTRLNLADDRPGVFTDAGSICT